MLITAGSVACIDAGTGANVLQPKLWFPNQARTLCVSTWWFKTSGHPRKQSSQQWQNLTVPSHLFIGTTPEPRAKKKRLVEGVSKTFKTKKCNAMYCGKVGHYMDVPWSHRYRWHAWVVSVYMVPPCNCLAYHFSKGPKCIKVVSEVLAPITTPSVTVIDGCIWV